MSCLHPLPAYLINYHDENGLIKQKIKFINTFQYSEDRMKSVFGNSLIMIPCGKCLACKMAYRKDWAVRCEMESMFHEKSCFVTLTLDDDHLKPLPVKEDVQYFLHKLRDSYGIKCRYFACGELGSKGRSHYHMILFGYKPEDLKFYGLSKSGFPMYTSKFLTKVWNKGLVQIQDFDFSCAAYVAGYVKKDKNQAFIMESTRPGLGAAFMESNLHKLFKYGHYQGKSGQIHRLPRYFKKVCEKYGYDPIHLAIDGDAKMEFLNTSAKFDHRFTHDGQLNALNEVLMKDKLKKLKRSL